jgi:hypothetical protein
MIGGTILYNKIMEKSGEGGIVTVSKVQDAK